MFKDDLFAGQRVLVTGGGTGLGLAMAEQLAALGAEVHLCGRRASVLDEAADQLRARFGATVATHSLDIRSPQAVDDMMEAIWTGYGPLDSLVNNAAGNFISRTEDLSPRGFDAIANIVFRGSFFMTLDCGKRWIASGQKASVVSILTTWIWNGGPFTVPSAMSKAGLHAMTMSLAVEWAPKGIRFNAIAPGPFPTEGAWARLSPGQSTSGAGKADPTIPLNRVGEMRELANLAVYLLDPGSAYVNGQTIAIDGGGYLSGRGRADLASWTDEQWEAARDAIKGANEKDRAQRTV